MMTEIKTLKDIEQIEATPLEQRLQGNTGYETLVATVAKFPDRVAITALEPGNPLGKSRDVTFTELLENVNKTANMFRSRGLKEDESVTHFLPLVPEGFYVKIAAETVGIVNPVNPMLEVEHIVGITESANTRILVIPGKDVSEEFFNKGIEVAKANSNIHTIYVLGGDDECDTEILLPLEASIAEQDGLQITGGVVGSLDDVVAYYHTGGSTGVPKLAQHVQRMRVAQTVGTGMMFGFNEQDSIILGLPLFHAAGSLILGLFPLFCGSRVVLLSPDGFRDKAAVKEFWKVIERHQVTVFMGVPTVFSALLNLPVGDEDLSSIRIALTGGSPVPTEVLKAMSERIGIEICQGFGMTELGGMCTIQTAPSKQSRGSAGIRQPYIHMKIGVPQADGQVRGEAEPNEIGILCFKGPCVMPGYAGGRAQEETFTEDGWLNTGDLARIDENGELWITGRAKDLIIRGGHNIDAMIIEDALHRHPAVEVAAAVGKPDEYAGELPIAYVQRKPDHKVSAQELMEFGKREIVERAAAPTEIILVDEIPKTGVDKVFKPALRFDAIKRTYENRIAENPAITVEAEVDVDSDPSVGVLARVFLNGKKCEVQEAIVSSTLNPFATRYSIEWIM